MKYRIIQRDDRWWPQRRRHFWPLWHDLAPHDLDCGPKDTHFLAVQGLRRHLFWLRNLKART